MLKYLDTAIVFAELPDEISLAIDITNCPHRCKNCHSPYLREDIGYKLTEDVLRHLIKSNKQITAVIIMGGDSDHDYIKELANIVHKNNLKICLYSGDDDIDNSLINYLDYYKVGSYKEEYGPLNNPKTNQKLYYIENNKLIDITYKFWPIDINKGSL